MTTLQMYLDESGHSSSDPFVVVAGYPAPAERWEGFQEAWTSALNDARLADSDGSVAMFHMTDFEARRRAFKHLTNDERTKLLSRLFAVIERGNLYAVGFVVSVRWWNSVPWAEITPEHIPLEDPYHLATQLVIQSTLRLVAEPGAPDLHRPERILCTFARQGEFGGKARAYIPKLAEHFSTSETHIEVAFDSPNERAELQAADIVAFELRRRFARPDVERWPMRQIIESGRAAFGAMPAEEVAPAAASLGGESVLIESSDRVLRTRPEVLKAYRDRVTKRPS